MPEDILPKIAQDAINFHRDQWRAYENQRQWLILAFITFSGVLTSSYFSSGARDAVKDLGVSPSQFLILVVTVDIVFGLLASFADALFARQARMHNRKATQLVIKLAEQSDSPPELKANVLQVSRIEVRPFSVSAMTYAAVIATNLVILKIFVFRNAPSIPYYFSTLSAAAVIAAILHLLRNRDKGGSLSD